MKFDWFVIPFIHNGLLLYINYRRSFHFWKLHFPTISCEWVYSRTSPYGHLTKPVTPPFWSPWLSPKWFPMVKNRTLVPVIRSPPYSGIRSVIPSQVAESPRYNGQSRPRSDNWLHIHLIQAAAGGRSLRPTTTKGNQTLVGVIQSVKDRVTSIPIKYNCK